MKILPDQMRDRVDAYKKDLESLQKATPKNGEPSRATAATTALSSALDQLATRTPELAAKLGVSEPQTSDSAVAQALNALSGALAQLEAAGVRGHLQTLAAEAAVVDAAAKQRGHQDSIAHYGLGTMLAEVRKIASGADPSPTPWGKNVLPARTVALVTIAEGLRGLQRESAAIAALPAMAAVTTSADTKALIADMRAMIPHDEKEKSFAVLIDDLDERRRGLFTGKTKLDEFFDTEKIAALGLHGLDLSKTFPEVLEQAADRIEASAEDAQAAYAAWQHGGLQFGVPGLVTRFDPYWFEQKGDTDYDAGIRKVADGYRSLAKRITAGEWFVPNLLSRGAQGPMSDFLHQISNLHNGWYLQ